MKHDYIIGIDPDALKSGVACLSLKTMRVDLFALPFPELTDYLKDVNLVLPNSIIYVEAGWLSESNWHLGKYDSRQLAASKGNSVGRNQETGRKIIEMAKHYGLEVLEVRPLKKCWRGPDDKITHDEIAYFMPGFPARSNQETRDAALLAWNYAGFPIKIKPKQSKP